MCITYSVNKKQNNFNPRQIKVGAKYTHKSFPGTVYLGIGDDCDGIKKKKQLIILYLGDDNSDLPIGTIVASPKTTGQGFWNMFEPLETSVSF